MNLLPLRVNPALAATAATALCIACAPAFAQYKVIGADGSVTYTDRPPSTATVKVTKLGRDAQAELPITGGGDPALPFELRQASARFPVTLYTTADCTPCDSGRQLLQQRGVPYTERRIVSEEDALALERSVGGRTVPALTVGSQPLRGLSPDDWTAYLDAAGYPRESKLPRGWQAPAPTALVDRVAVPRAAPQPAPARAAPEPALPPAASAPPDLKF